jgi:hypothetical protein
MIVPDAEYLIRNVLRTDEAGNVKLEAVPSPLSRETVDGEV